jgi:acyl carrier protein
MTEPTDKLKDIIIEQLGCDPTSITLDTKLEDLGADSLDMVELVMAIECEYEVDISDEEAMTFVTVHDIQNYLINHAA